MKIVVTTPTGNVGSRVTRLLLQAGERPTLLLRDASRLDAEVAALVDVVEGDQLVDADVLRATAGAEAVFWVDPPAAPDDPVDPLAHYTRAGEAIARAVREHAIPRVVFQSSVGAELRSGAGEIDGMGATEALLDATGASVVHLRCGFFFTNLLLDPDALERGVQPIVLPPDLEQPWVDPRDIADVAAARLLSAAWSGRIVQAVHGPRHLSWQQAAEIVTAATGRALRVEQVSEEELHASLTEAGMSDAAARGLIGASASPIGFTPEDPRTILTTTPTTLAAWAHEHLRGT